MRGDFTKPEIVQDDAGSERSIEGRLSGKLNRHLNGLLWPLRDIREQLKYLTAKSLGTR